MKTEPSMGLNYYQIKKNVRKARKLVIRGTTAAGSGHPGGSFYMAEIIGAILFKYLPQVDYFLKI